MEVEDQVELAHILEVSVEHLDEMMDHVEDNKLVVVFLDACGEVQTGVASEHDLVFAPFQEMCQAGASSDDHGAHFFLNRLSLFMAKV